MEIDKIGLDKWEERFLDFWTKCPMWPTNEVPQGIVKRISKNAYLQGVNDGMRYALERSKI